MGFGIKKLVVILNVVEGIFLVSCEDANFFNCFLIKQNDCAIFNWIRTSLRCLVVFIPILDNDDVKLGTPWAKFKLEVQGRGML